MNRNTIAIILSYLFIIDAVSAGIAPNIPANGRAEYYLLQNDGSYRYGYDTGSGIYAKQSATNGNEVEGNFAYNSNGELINVKYTAGVQGYKPELPASLKAAPLVPAPAPASNGWSDSVVVSSYSADSGDMKPKPYSFSYQSDNHQRQESADGSGFVQGKYSYTDESGTHDLHYKAGPATGFEVTGGSLAQPDIAAKIAAPAVSKASWSSTASVASPAVLVKSDNTDGSYSFEYNAGDSSRQESADAAGNVRGRYSYTNAAGNHDLSYVAGAATGFQVTGGSLAQPDIAAKLAAPAVSKTSWSSTASVASPAVLVKSENTDGSYSFEYNAGDSSRQESADAAGNVRGRYSYTNAAGNHDLSYVAGAATGFQVTGGSLAQPDVVAKLAAPAVSKASWSAAEAHKAYIQPQALQLAVKTNYDDGNNDGSYSFEYNTGDSSRQESADKAGNVRGSYSFTNEAGNHDLTYVAGADTGFKVTGGSLATANGLSDSFNAKSAAEWQTKSASQSGSWSSAPVAAVKSDANQNNDGSYSFEYNAGDSSRQESADKAGNVRGSYSFTNEAGNHDLSYVAGADTGFKVTGGSLATANGLSDTFNAKSAAEWQTKSLTKSHVQQSLNPLKTLGSESGHSLSGGSTNGAYSFEYSTNDQSRKESADASGNVKGVYSYSNDAGTHDLTYIAGPSTGFIVTGGSLAKAAELAKTVSTASQGALVKSHHASTVQIHGGASSSHSEQPIAGRSVLLKTAQGSIGTNWLPVPENYKAGYYFQH